MVAEMTDRFGALPGPVANLLAVVRLKTEAAVLGYESLAARDNEMIFKIKRTVAPDRVALYKRFRNDVRVQLGEVRIPRRVFPTETQAWLAALHELLPVIVGVSRPPSPATPASEDGNASAGGQNGRASSTTSPRPISGDASPRRP